MMYRRYPPRFGRHVHSPPGPPADDTYKDFPTPGQDPLLGSFPLPKLTDEQDEMQRKPPRNVFPFLDIIKQYNDEIIILALLFILLQEGVQDEFLIIILIYLIFAGRD